MNAVRFVMHYPWGDFIVHLLANLQDPELHNDPPWPAWGRGEVWL